MTVTKDDVMVVGMPGGVVEAKDCGSVDEVLEGTGGVDEDVGVLDGVVGVGELEVEVVVCAVVVGCSLVVGESAEVVTGTDTDVGRKLVDGVAIVEGRAEVTADTMLVGPSVSMAVSVTDSGILT